MITAKITAIRSSRNGGIPFAFARANELQSDYNPDGFVTFTIVPEIWSGRELPRIGDTVALGQLKKKEKPEWPAPRWRAFQAKPLNGTSPAPRLGHFLPIPRKPRVPPTNGRGLWARLLGLLRHQREPGAHVSAN